MTIKLTNEEMANIRQELNRKLAVEYLQTFNDKIKNIEELGNNLYFLDELGEYIQAATDDEYENIRCRFEDDERVKWN